MDPTLVSLIALVALIVIMLFLMFAPFSLSERYEKFILVAALVSACVCICSFFLAVYDSAKVNAAFGDEVEKEYGMQVYDLSKRGNICKLVIVRKDGAAKEAIAYKNDNGDIILTENGNIIKKEVTDVH